MGKNKYPSQLIYSISVGVEGGINQLCLYRLTHIIIISPKNEMHEFLQL